MTADVIGVIVAGFALVATFLGGVATLNARMMAKIDQRFEQVNKRSEREFAAVRGEISTLRQEMREEFSAVRQEMHDGDAAVRQEMRDGFAAVRQEMHDGDATLRGEISTLQQEMRDGFAAARQETHGDISELRTEVLAYRDDVVSVKISVARLEGTPPRLLTAR